MQSKIKVAGLLTLLAIGAVWVPAGAHAQVDFAAVRRYATGGSPQPSAIAVGDFNGDGVPDIVAAVPGDVTNGVDGNVVVFVGNGDGTFQPGQTVAAGKYPGALAVGDFNGDGIADFAVGDSVEPNVQLFLGKKGGLPQAMGSVVVGSGQFGQTMAAVDLNADGKLDLVVGNSADNTISVLLGKGDGSFQPAVAYDVGASPTALVIGDFNGDQRPDVVVAVEGMPTTEKYHGDVVVLLGKGDGTLQPPMSTNINARTFSIAAGDWNGDGKLDLVATIQSGIPLGPQLMFLLGNGDGSFAPAVSLDSSQAPSVLVSYASVAMADFDQDGKLDVATAVLFYSDGAPKPPVVRVYLGDGTGKIKSVTDFPVDGELDALYLADFNADKLLDVAVVNEDMNGGNVAVLLNSSAHTARLSVNVTGSGTVSSQPDGIMCPASCSASFAKGTSVTLTATSAAASTNFVEWSGACAGGGTCELTMAQNATVTAEFQSTATFSLTASPPKQTTIPPGSSTTATVNVSAMNNTFTGTVTLTCQVTPSAIGGPQCAVAPNSVSVGEPAVLTISAGANSACVPGSFTEHLQSRAIGLLATVVLFICVCAYLASERRRVPGVVFLAVLLLALAGCGGGSGSSTSGTSKVQPAASQTYTVTVIGSSGTEQEFAQVIVTVK